MPHIRVSSRPPRLSEAALALLVFAVPSSAVADPTALAVGRELATRGDWSKRVPPCASCHGAVGLGVGSVFPPLAGKTSTDLAGALRAWKAGTRRDDPLGLMTAIAGRLDDAQIAAVATYYASPSADGSAPLPQDDSAAKLPSDTSHVHSASNAPATSGSFAPPPESAIPNDAFGAEVRRGEAIFLDPSAHARAYVGNSLRCSSCHLDAGRLADSAPLAQAYVRYPAFRSKLGRVSTYEERLQGCFRYSMNGKAPPLGDDVLVALASYSYFLARGAPTGVDLPGRGYPRLAKPALGRDYARGEAIFDVKCALCHGAEGAGQADAGGAMVFPALWGPGSFNWGAGMASIGDAAGFIKANMPLGLGGSLTDQEAWDVATFVDSHERPQDPRFTKNVATTRAAFHDTDLSMYGRSVNGEVLGTGSPPAGPSSVPQGGPAAP